MNDINSGLRSSATIRTGGRTPGVYAWVSGAVLVVLGGLFLLHNVGVVPAPGHWWALFLLIPAAVTAGTAWAQYQAGGRRLTPAARPAARSSGAWC